VACCPIKRRAAAVEPYETSAWKSAVQTTFPVICLKAISKETTANSAVICLTATSDWVMSVQTWEHLLTDGREVTSDGTQKEVR
jgi:hypothetical protein